MTDPDAVRRSYDGLAEDYAAQRTQDGPGMAVLEEFLDALPTADPDGPTRVLDAGCGQGTPVLARLVESFDAAVGLDFSREQLRLAAGSVPAATLCQGDMTRLPFRDGAFDAVTAYHSLIHVPFDDHPTVLAEFARVLRPGGRLLVSEGDREWTGENPDWLDSGVGMQWDIAGAEATLEQLREGGFVVTDEWDVPDTTVEEDATKPFFAAKLET